MPLKNAGMRIEPPMSLPMPKGDAAAAWIAPSPPDDPPTIRLVSYGLFVRPWLGLTDLQKSLISYADNKRDRYSLPPHAQLANVSQSKGNGTGFSHLFYCRRVFVTSDISSVMQSARVQKPFDLDAILRADGNAQERLWARQLLDGHCSALNQLVSSLGVFQSFRKTLIDDTKKDFASSLQMIN